MHWKYKNLLIGFIGVIVAFLLSQYQPFISYLLNLGTLGLIGAFFAGALYTLSFTIPISILMFSVLSQTLSPLELGLVGDLTIFKYVRDDLITEIKPLYDRFGGDHVSQVFHSKYFHWTLPFIGALIIASPFPDEIGVSLMGIAKMKTLEFIPISFTMNSVGIFIIVSVSSLLK
jgi:hypothetical protein